MRVPEVGCVAALWLLGQAGPGPGPRAALALSLDNKQCGSRVCPALSFCHESTNTCRNCSDICRPNLPSQYEPGTCQEHCQDYLYEQMKGHSTDGTARVLSAVGIGVGVVALILVLLAIGLLYYIYRRPHVLANVLARAAGNSGTKISPSSNNNKCDIERDLERDSPAIAPVSTISAEALRLNIADAVAASSPHLPLHSMSNSHSPTTPMTASTHLGPPAPARHPSEDSTLDYAYDNLALSPSPVMPSAHATTLPGTLPATTPLHNGAVLNRMESRI